MAAIKYSAANGARLSDSQAAIFGERITQLSEKQGFVTPKMVLDDARKPSSPMHEYFDWDNKKAAECWRIEQAKYLIRNIVVTVVNEECQEVRHFFSITPTEGMKTDATKVYVTLNSVLSDDNKRKEVVAYALRELNGWTERYRQYSELTPFVKILEDEMQKFHA